MTKEEMLEAIEELRKMGFKVIKEERAHIPEQAKEQITEDLEYYSEIISDRLGQLEEGISQKIINEPMAAMTETERLHNHYSDEKVDYRRHEIENLSMAALCIYNIKQCIVEGDIVGLFQAGVGLGDGLPPGDALYALDIGEMYDTEKEMYHAERKKSGKNRQDVKAFNEMKPFIFKEAARYWEENPKALLKDVVKHITLLPEQEFPHRFDKYPQKSTIRRYLKEAHEDPQNDFKIPEHALKPGRRS